jgi:hypothetical protein
MKHRPLIIDQNPPLISHEMNKHTEILIALAVTAMVLPLHQATSEPLIYARWSEAPRLTYAAKPIFLENPRRGMTAIGCINSVD